MNSKCYPTDPITDLPGFNASERVGLQALTACFRTENSADTWVKQSGVLHPALAAVSPDKLTA